MSSSIFKLFLIASYAMSCNTFSMPCSSGSYVYNKDNVLIQLLGKPQENTGKYIQSVPFHFHGCKARVPIILDTGSDTPFEIQFHYNDVLSQMNMKYSRDILDTVHITPYRNEFNKNLYIPAVKSVEAIVHELMHKPLHAERYNRILSNTKCETRKLLLNGFNLFPYLSSDKNLVKHTYEDGLISVVPKILPQKKHFKLVFGCKHDDEIYKHLFVYYDTDGKLKKVTYDIFRMPKMAK